MKEKISQSQKTRGCLNYQQDKSPGKQHEIMSMNYYNNKKIPYAFNKGFFNPEDSQMHYDIYTPAAPLNTHFIGPVRTGKHHHNYFEAIYIISGQMTQVIEDTPHHYSAGQCSILNLNVNHYEIYSGDIEILFMMLTEEFLEPLIHPTNAVYDSSFDSIRHFLRQNQKNNYYPAKEYISFLPLSNRKETKNTQNEIISSLCHTASGQAPGCTLMVAGLLTHFFSILENPGLYQKQLIQLIGTNEERILEQINAIFQREKRRLNRQDVAAELNYNSDYLNRIVKKATGMTLVEYGQLFCLDEAAHLLLHTDLSVSDIVTRVGFTNRSYFNRIFTRKYGVTPKQFRENR